MKQVIVIKLDGIYYGINVDIVQEVVYSYAERSLPEAPNFIEGLAYVREQLLPIVRTKRLFDSAFFDLYGNKKVLVLSFARMKGQSVDTDTSSVGIVIDDVIGIESYEDIEISSVPSVYSTNISHEILGFINKRGFEIAILNIANFFLDADGHFRYQKYVHKNNDANSYHVSKEDLQILEKSINGFFPFTDLTKRPILVYMSRLAGFENNTISGLLKNNPKFFETNIHSKKKTGREFFFNNAPDMYVILEYLANQLKSNQTNKTLVVDTKNSSSAVSLVLAIDSIRKGKASYMIDHFITDGTTEDIAFVYPKNMLDKITGEMIEKYFTQSPDKLYTLKNSYQSKVHCKSGEIENLHKEGKLYDVIYAPNFLISHMDELEYYVKFFEYITQKGGILILGLFEDIEDFAKSFKKYYIKSRLVFVKG